MKNRILLTPPQCYHNTTQHKCDTAVHKTKEPNTIWTVRTIRRERHGVGLQACLSLDVDNIGYPNYVESTVVYRMKKRG